MRFLLIPPGEFDMGSTEKEKENLLEQARARNLPGWYVSQLSWETPQHRVRITRPFYLGRYEVMQAEWVRVESRNPSHFQDDPTRPADQVTWDEATAFCQKLGQLPAEQAVKVLYRLPTEAEWEYACRAGTTTTWYATENEAAVQEQAWMHVNAPDSPHPAGQKVPNAWGLYDMHGNLWEWCQDWAADRYYSVSPTDDPTGPPDDKSFSESWRIYRGGSWWDEAVRCRAAYRGALAPRHRENDFGFRVVMSVPLVHREPEAARPSDVAVPSGAPQARDGAIPKPFDSASSNPFDRTSLRDDVPSKGELAISSGDMTPPPQDQPIQTQSTGRGELSLSTFQPLLTR